MPKYSGEFPVPCSKEDVYDFLMEPERLVKCVPGLQRYEIEDVHNYSAMLRVGVAQIQASLTVKIEVMEDSKEAGYARIRGSGSMLGSAVQVEGHFNLVEEPDDNTLVKWAGEAKLGARLLGIIGHFLEPVVRDNIQCFVDAVQAEMIAAQISSAKSS